MSAPVVMQVGTDDCLLPSVGSAAVDDTDAVMMSLPDSPPMSYMPPDLCYWYTQGGRIPVSKLYYDDKSDPSHSYQPRTREYIENLIQRARNREIYYYNTTDTWMYEAMDAHPIKGLDVLIIGSNIPWYEAMCLAHGARSCTTLEYNQVQYEHPALTTVMVKDFERWRGGRRWDVAWSVSSFEHDGLGRYGDTLKPEADLQAMRRVLDYVHLHTGLLFLSVPVGDDAIVWNCQRVYGAHRLPLLLAEWNVVSTYGYNVSDLTQSEHQRGGHQPVFVLKPALLASTSAAAVSAALFRFPSVANCRGASCSNKGRGLGAGGRAVQVEVGTAGTLRQDSAELGEGNHNDEQPSHSLLADLVIQRARLDHRIQRTQEALALRGDAAQGQTQGSIGHLPLRDS
jgi:hypothetical protein